MRGRAQSSSVTKRWARRWPRRSAARIGDGRAGARLVVSLGPPCPAAERRVRLGDGDDADYVVAGEPAALAKAMAAALGKEKP